MDWLDIMSILLDVPIPIAIMLDIYLLRTFIIDRKLCPVFAWCLKHIFLTHMVIYFCELFIRLPAMHGILLNFYKDNASVIGKIFFQITIAWQGQSTHWNAVMAVSRVWCIMGRVSFQHTWTPRVQWVITAVLWGINFALTTHIYFNVDCRYWQMGNDSISFGTVTPDFISTFYSLYIPNMALIITVICYGYLTLALTRTRAVSKLAKQTLFAQFLINIPKMSYVFVLTYSHLQTTLFTQLPEINLKLFWLLLQIGSVFYGINATIVVFVCFPETGKRLSRWIRGIQSERTSSLLVKNEIVAV